MLKERIALYERSMMSSGGAPSVRQHAIPLLSLISSFSALPLPTLCNAAVITMTTTDTVQRTAHAADARRAGRVARANTRKGGSAGGWCVTSLNLSHRNVPQLISSHLSPPPHPPPSPHPRLSAHGERQDIRQEARGGSSLRQCQE